ncbi:MAG: hypothetical protein H6747_04095 [Deltaproteobacteria bacterium]|nr:hypothetical protein [Deltaproteobacteria bacterium]
MTRNPHRFPLLLLALALCAAPLHASASEPKAWSFVSGDDFAKGDLDGLALHPHDGLTVAPGLTRTEVDAELIHCWVRDGKRLWLGTGVEGRIFVVEGDKAREVAQVPAALVGSMVSDGRGGIYAGLVGKGEILHVDAGGKTETLVTLPDVQHVWALLRHGGELLAATGPGGKVFAIDTGSKKARVWAETDTEHALVLFEDKGAVLVGTAGSPMLIRVQAEGKAQAIASFPGAEVRSIARLGDRLFVAINGNPDVVKLQQLRATPDRPGKDKEKRATKARAKKASGGGGKGAVWARHDDGQLYQLFGSPVGLLSQIGASGQGVVVGAARGGRVLVGDLHGDVTTLFDLDEGAVLGVEMGPKGPTTLFTGRSAAVYRVGGPSARAAFTSEVLLASGVARWGRLETLGEGKLLVETRSGFSNPANDTWSAWQPLKNDRIQSPAATMLQVRVTLASPDARLRELHVHRRLLNRQPQIERLEVKYEEKGKVFRVNWGARDPDGDKLGYVVTYRRRGSAQWLMLHDRFYAKTSLGLSPKDMPDGWYEIRVEASDAQSNTPPESHVVARISKPFLVDQGRPTVVAEVKDGTLAGVATDASSRIVRVEVSFDGEPTVLCGAADGVFDGGQEAFELRLPPDLLKGTHTLLIQATDEAGNVGVTRLVVGGGGAK